MKHARKDYDRIQDPAMLIPEDEPVFLLRGQDKYTASTVRAYAELIAADPYATDDALDISARAFEWADKIDEWADKMNKLAGKTDKWQDKKSPDMPKGA